MLESLTNIVLLSISPFVSVNICLMYVGTHILGACILRIVTSSWIYPFVIMKYSSLSLITVFKVYFI